MKTMIGLMSLLVLTGCASRSKRPAVEIVSCEHVQITNVTFEQHDGEMTIRGVLRPRTSATRRVDHVDVALLGDDGRVLREVKAAANQQMHMRQSDRPPEFSVRVESGGVKSVRLAHHADAFAECGL
jgi:hypothetical protein